MESYLMIDGKRIPLTDEQIRILSEPEKKSPFERAKYGGIYFSILDTGNTVAANEANDRTDNPRFSVANYCTDRDLLQQRAWHETLSRMLWRFACENGELENPWNGTECHWYVTECRNRGLIVDYSCSLKSVGVPYFPSEKIAKRAIEEIVKPFMDAHPDFVW